VAGEAELRALADYVAPVRDGSQLLGALALRARPGGFLALPDVRLAADMANAAGLLLRNAELIDQRREQVRVETAQARELAASRRRVVVARDEAREQLSAEIQAAVCEPLERCAARVERALLALDGPAADPGPDGPASPSLGAPAAGPALVAGLAEISAGIDATIADFRRIVHGVYPPVLTDHGLRAAMESLLTDIDPGASLLPHRIPRLAARVEAGTYFCAAALLREWQGAGAQRPMRVLVGVSSSRIQMTFVDGVVRTPTRPATPVSPRVLEAVQDRVAAMGGDLNVEGDASGRLLVIDVPLVTADLAAWGNGADQ
jgi:signal transduction histidine kinase